MVLNVKSEIFGSGMVYIEELGRGELHDSVQK